MVNTSKLEFTQLQSKIFRALCQQAGKSLNQSQIAKLLKASPPGIAKAVKYLEESKLIQVQASDSMNLHKIELAKNDLARNFKRTENLQQIYKAIF